MTDWLEVIGRFAVPAFALAVSACSSHPPAAEGAQAPIATASGTPSPDLSASPASSAPPAPPSAPGAASSAAPPAPSGSTTPPTTGKMCGGIAGIRCGDKQYCAFPPEARCGAGDMAGACAPIPDLCTMEYAPVCGCDGKTYGSKCVAARARISVAKAGTCEQR